MWYSNSPVVALFLLIRCGHYSEEQFCIVHKWSGVFNDQWTNMSISNVINPLCVLHHFHPRHIFVLTSYTRDGKGKSILSNFPCQKKSFGHFFKLSSDTPRNLTREITSSKTLELFSLPQLSAHLPRKNSTFGKIRRHKKTSRFRLCGERGANTTVSTTSFC